MTRRLASALLVGTLCLASAAMASTIDFVSPPNPLGNIGAGPVVYTFPGTSLTISASGFCSPGCSAGNDLFAKNNGGDENGLGLASDTTGENEIFFQSGTTAFVQIDVSDLLSHGITSMQFSMGSVTNNETWTVFGCGSSLILCNNALVSGSDEFPTNHTITFSSSDPFLDFVSEGTTVPGGPNVFGNVLLHTVSEVPEPASMALFGSGLLGLAGVIRRRIIK